jgi:MFS family permease
LANQLSGINAILFYARQVFEHITNHNSLLSKQYTLYLGLLQVVVTFASGFLINRFGRRTLMLLGETMVVSSLLIGFMADVGGM